MSGSCLGQQSNKSHIWASNQDDNVKITCLNFGLASLLKPVHQSLLLTQIYIRFLLLVSTDIVIFKTLALP